MLLGFWALLQFGAFHAVDIPVLAGGLIDTDSYMKLVRIERLLTVGGWFDGTIPRGNAPFGETLHWTRPFDLAVIALAAPLLPFLSVHDALFWAGAAVSPLLHLALGFALLWAMRPLREEIGPPAAVIATLLTLAQSGVLGYGIAGRADHHALLFVLFTSILGAFLRMGGGAAAPRSRWVPPPPVLAGLLCAAGAWSGIELTAVALAGACACGLLWVLNRIRLRDNLAFACTFALTLAVALVIERPPAQYFVAEYDRISVAHLAAAGALAGVWTALALLQRRVSLATARQRLAAASATSLAIAAGLYLLLPALFAGPAASFDPAMRTIWLERVQEMQPLWPTTRVNAAKMITFLGIAFLAMPVLVLRLLRRPLRPHWLILGVTMLAVLPAAFLHLRMAPYAEIVAGIALATLLHRVLSWSADIAALLPRVAIRSGAIMALLAPFAAASAVPRAEGDGAAAEQTTSPPCELRPLARFLASPPWSAQPRTILTFVDFGPELLYRTPHRVIASPYHRNVAGIAETYRALSGPAERAVDILEKRSVDLIFLCTAAAEARAYARAPAASLYARLLRGDLPPDIAVVALPPGTPGSYRLYTVGRR